MTENVFTETEAPLTRLFDKVVASRSDAIALIYEDRRITFFELQLYVEWMSGYFQSINLRPGQRVALLLPNSPKFVIGFFGLLRAGGVAVPLDISRDVHELRLMLLRSKVSAIMTTPEYKPLLDKALAKGSDNGAPLPRLTIAIFEEDNIVTLIKGAHERQVTNDLGKGARPEDSTKILPANGQPHPEAPSALVDLPAVVHFKDLYEFYVRPHAELAREAEAMMAQTQLTANDRLVCLAPLCQPNCLSHCVIATVAAGATLVLLEPDNWENIWQVLTDERVTILASSAALLMRVAENKTATDTFLRWYLCTDTSLSPELGERLQQKMGFKIGQLTDTINTGIPCQL